MASTQPIKSPTKDEKKEAFARDQCLEFKRLLKRYPGHWFHRGRIDSTIPDAPMYNNPQGNPSVSYVETCFDSVYTFHEAAAAEGFARADFPVRDELSRLGTEWEKPWEAEWENPYAIAWCLQEFVNTSMKYLRMVKDGELGGALWNEEERESYVRFRARFDLAKKQRRWHGSVSGVLLDDEAEVLGLETTSEQWAKNQRKDKENRKREKEEKAKSG